MLVLLVLTRARGSGAALFRSVRRAAEPTGPTCPLGLRLLFLLPTSCLLRSGSTYRAGRCVGLPGTFWLVHLLPPLSMLEPVLDSRIGSHGSVSPLSRSTLAETRQQAPAEERSQDLLRA